MHDKKLVYLWKAAEGDQVLSGLESAGGFCWAVHMLCSMLHLVTFPALWSRHLDWHLFCIASELEALPDEVYVMAQLGSSCVHLEVIS